MRPFADRAVEEDIAHLDFTSELPAPPPKIRHYAHPTDPRKSWCGAASGFLRYTGKGGTPASEITCAGCLHELIDKGRAWWWNVHRLYYRSTCTPEGHSCEWEA